MAEGWVRMYHPNQHDEIPDPDDPNDAVKFATVTQKAFDTVWSKRGWVDIDQVRESTSESTGENSEDEGSTATTSEEEQTGEAPAPRARRRTSS